MTIREIMNLEIKLGRKASQQEIRDEEIRQLMEIRAYANQHGYTDVHPFEVIRKISDICVEVRAMRTVQTRFPQDFHAGGFAGHYSDNRSGQEYEYHSDPNNPVLRIRWSKAKKQWQCPGHRRFVMSDKPYKFYDYNF
jgi:hypothetical protein